MNLSTIVLEKIINVVVEEGISWKRKNKLTFDLYYINHFEIKRI